MHKKIIHKRFLAWMLAFAMVFGMLPMSLAAEEEPQEESVVQGQSENQQEEDALPDDIEDNSQEEEENGQVEVQQEQQPDSDEQAEPAEQLEELLLADEIVAFDAELDTEKTLLHFATYVGQVPELPEQICLEDGTALVDVSWQEEAADAYATPYSLVALTGTYSGGNVTAYVEVIPERTVFFSDIQFLEGTSSDAYDAVAKFLEEQGDDALLNTVNHQMYSSGGWGLASAFANKGASSSDFTINLSNKLHTGNYMNNQQGLTYYLPITQAGTYTIATGHAEYWSKSRNFNIYVDVGNTTYPIASSVSVSASSTFAEVSGSFTVTEEEAEAGAVVKLRIARVTNDITLSYIIVSREADASDRLADYIAQVENSEQGAYTARSWYNFQTALTAARELLDDNASMSAYEAALSTLKQAYEALEVDVSATALHFALRPGQSEADLPAQIRLTDGGNLVDVSWDSISADDYEVFEAVSISGDAEGQSLDAIVEIIPDNLVYFINAGTDSPNVYNAIDAASRTEDGDYTLLNEQSNQLYSEGSWGYTYYGGTPTYKGTESVAQTNDKDYTAIKIDGNNTAGYYIAYTLPLEPGSYRITTYHMLWWNNEMPFRIDLSYELNGETVSQTVNRIHIDIDTGYTRCISYEFELPEGAGEVTYTFTSVGKYTSGPGASATSKNASISWLAIEDLQGAEVEAMRYESILGFASETGEIWLDTSGNVIQAHGGQVQWYDNLYDFSGDGTLDGGWYWVGEDKTYGGRPIGGVHAYVSEDLYNWIDMGVILYTHRTLPIEVEGDSVQVSQSQLTQLKQTASGDGDASEIEIARDFLQAYVEDIGYSRSNESFNYVSASYDDDALELAFDRLFAYYCIAERPKMLYNKSTEQYVLVYHVDGPSDENLISEYNTLVSNPAGLTSSRYSRAQMGFAVSDSPFGPFKLVNAQRMNYVEGQYSKSYGMARDMTVFLDVGVDANNDGVEDAYAIYSSEENAHTYVSLLNSDYTAPANNGTAGHATTVAEGESITFVDRVFGSYTSREAPAIFKYDGYYYFITSGTTGWDPNPTQVFRATHIFGNWNESTQSYDAYEYMGDPFPSSSTGYNTSFRTQSTAVIPVDAENGLFIYMGDRWTQNYLDISGYVWMPIQINTDGSLSIYPVSDWTFESDLYPLAPLQIRSELPQTMYFGGTGSELPSTLDVSKAGVNYDDVSVSWSESDIIAAAAKLGTASISGTLVSNNSAINGSVITVSLTVIPRNVLYFADTGASSISDYFALMAADTSNATLRNTDTPDQEYGDEVDWGHFGDVTLRDRDDIYESLIYPNARGVNIGYSFDVEAGEYEILLGLYDPWGKTNRYVDISVSDGVNTLASSENVQINSTAKTLALSVEIDEAGTLTVTLTPRSSSNSDNDALLSFAVLRDTAVRLSGITVTSTPDKTAYYIGEALDKTGMEISATYSDGSVVDITGLVEIGDFDSSSVGEKTITVSYGGFEVEFLVTVSKKSSGVLTDAPPATSGTNISDTETPLSSGEEAITINGEESKLEFNSDGSVSITEELLAAYEDAVVIGIPYEEDNASDSVLVLANENDKVIVISSASDGMMYALIDEAGEYSVKAVTVSFADTSKHWAADNIAFVAAHGLFQGMDDEHFAPDLSMTRAMFVTVLARLGDVDLSDYTTSSFDDVEVEAWYAAAVTWAAEAGIVNGVGNGMFAPEQEVTREQMAVMLVAYLKYAGYSLPSTTETVSFADAESISSWAAEAVTAMQQAGILTGRTDGSFDPQGIATRGEVATLFTRVIEALLA